MPMSKSSLTENNDFQKLIKLYGVEDTVYFFNSQGELNSFGEKTLTMIKELKLAQAQLSMLEKKYSL